MKKSRPIKSIDFATGARSDGRRERSRSSRSAIIGAMAELIRRGNVSPTADQVASFAGVGQRTVFRHFSDMESIYREVAELVEERLMPMTLKPYEARRWQDRIREAARRRIGIYEELMPFRTAADLKRFDSEVLMHEYRRHLRLEWTTLAALLPEAVQADSELAIALHVALSFQCWRRLREDEDLDIEKARGVIMRMVEAVLCMVERDHAGSADESSG